jgi:hypothetical protein
VAASTSDAPACNNERAAGGRDVVDHEDHCTRHRPDRAQARTRSARARIATGLRRARSADKTRCNSRSDQSRDCPRENLAVVDALGTDALRARGRPRDAIERRRALERDRELAREQGEEPPFGAVLGAGDELTRDSLIREACRPPRERRRRRDDRCRRERRRAGVAHQYAQMSASRATCR